MLGNHTPGNFLRRFWGDRVRPWVEYLNHGSLMKSWVIRLKPLLKMVVISDAQNGIRSRKGTTKIGQIIL